MENQFPDLSKVELVFSQPALAPSISSSTHPSSTPTANPTPEAVTLTSTPTTIGQLKHKQSYFEGGLLNNDDFAIEPYSLLEAGQMESLTMSLDKLIAYFKNFKVAEIELTVSGAAETNGFLRLAVAAKGQGGVRILLKPAETVSASVPNQAS